MSTRPRRTGPLFASQSGHVEVVQLLLARQGVEVNHSDSEGGTALFLASQNGHVEVVWLLLARQGVEVNQTAQSGSMALMFASQNGHVEEVRLLLARQDVEANRSLTDGRSAQCVASRSGHGAIVSLLVAQRAHGQVRLLAADAIDSLPAILFKELPGFTAQAAALRLPLDVAAALGDTEEERAAADVVAS
jgi:ankyrin repeat protein